ncbi:unnamed protein product [Sphagnum jensenii]|uniref:Uncharacterized protein n=1 Tax=Sphagnum jensenii TaxID=128206 RepID=A0ABP0X5H8_9BRYO
MECPPTLESYGVENVQLAPEREHQRIKAALAVALCISWACRSPPSDRIHQLQQVTFPSPIGHVLQRSCVLIVVPSFRAASLRVPGLVETASYDMLDTENDFHDYDLSILEDWMQTNLRSSIAAVSHEERHAAHIELLSELKNSTGSGGQQEGCIVGS